MTDKDSDTIVKGEEVDESQGIGFDDEYEDFQSEWERDHQSIGRAGNILRQQDLKLGETRVRIVDPCKYFSCFVHSMQDTHGKWKRLVCHGEKEIMLDKSRKPPMDPEHCPICEHILANNLKQGFPKRNFYFRVISRQRQAECTEQGIPNEILILQCGPQLFDSMYDIATTADYKEDLFEDDGTTPKMDPRKPGVQASRINLTLFDFIIKKEKTGNADVDVQYSAQAAWKGRGPLTDEEAKLIAEGLPSVDNLIKPSSEEKIKAVLFGESDGSESEPDEPRGRRTAKSPSSDSGDVPFDKE
jgi:hypothetical protein